MTKSSISKSYRSGFQTGEQQAFLLSCVLSSGLKNLTTFAKSNELHPKTVSEWKNEKYRMPHIVVQKLSKKYNAAIPGSYKKINSSELHKLAGVEGGKAVFKKYGCVGSDPSLRKEGWEKWWKTSGSKELNPILRQKLISIPKHSTSLAEFFGIMLGDGGLTEYQTKITLNSESDALYVKYVKELIYKLFKEHASVLKIKNAKASIVCLSRKDLTTFLVKNGLCAGNKVKEQVDIPDWIKKNLIFLKACVRGLYDTDGGVYFEKHHYKLKTYSYIRFSFVNGSKPLLRSVYQLLLELGIPSRLNIKRSVTIEGLRNVSKYFTLVGTSNPKHSLKYENFRILDKSMEKWQSGLTRSS